MTPFDLRLIELAGVIGTTVPSGEGNRRLGSVWILRSTMPTAPTHAMYMPMLCIIAQGEKELVVGDHRIVYDPGRFLLNAVAVPAAGRVAQATPEWPCLWIMIELDPAMVVSVMTEAGLAAPSPEPPQRAMEAGRLDLPTLEAVIRLARLFQTPEDADFLLPLRLREIVYRLLVGDQAAQLRQIAAHGGTARSVIRAIEWLRENFSRPMAVENLARECGLSPSALHHHFKEVTAMSPLQFQKQMRLQEASRLMVAEDLDAATAGFRVGYEDPAYFSREYRRFFGDPPRRHVLRMKGMVAPWNIEAPI